METHSTVKLGSKSAAVKSLQAMLDRVLAPTPRLDHPVKRLAFDRKANQEIDLLDHIEKVDRGHRRFLDPYR